LFAVEMIEAGGVVHHPSTLRGQAASVFKIECEPR
jgi:hypothetical protein